MLISKNGSSHNGHLYTGTPKAVIPYDMPGFLQVQQTSFEWLLKRGFRQVLDEISPIKDSAKRFELSFSDLEIVPGQLDIEERRQREERCRRQEDTYAGKIYITIKLKILSTGEIKEQKLFFGELPLMTLQGTFITNGAERVIVSQLIRSPGAYVTVGSTDTGTGEQLGAAKLLPYRGASVELETVFSKLLGSDTPRKIINVRIDRKSKFAITTLLRALGYSDEEMIAAVGERDVPKERSFIRATLEQELVEKRREDVRKKRERATSSLTSEWARQAIFERVRSGEPPTPENYNNMLNWMFLEPGHYDLGEVGRYKVNAQLHQDVSAQIRHLVREDFVGITRRLIEANNNPQEYDDIDHLGNRRVRAVGELIQNQLRVGFRRMERVIKDRMTTQIDPDTTTPAALINNRPAVAAVREFFGGSQLSQFMDQTNPLAELTHKRRLSVLGPGGLTRERAGFDVRDVHYSHYGRICPIETPEGPNIGLLGSFATYAQTNAHGFIVTPYRTVHKTISSKSGDLKNRTVTRDTCHPDTGEVVVTIGKSISQQQAETISTFPEFTVRVVPYVTNKPEDVVLYTADEEKGFLIAPSTTTLDKYGQFATKLVEVRIGETFASEPATDVSHMDVASTQIVSACTALIPFLEHNDAGRALMGSNMQRQAVPVIKPVAPLVGTGMEAAITRNSGHIVFSESDGIVRECSSNRIVVESLGGKLHTYELVSFRRSNQGTCINQRPVVNKGNMVHKGQVLADGAATKQGELALGQNLTVSFMSWEGYNYEDAIILSEDLVSNDSFTSVHIEKYQADARETKLGMEEITRDITNINDDSLKNLDENGIVHVGAWVKEGDILVGKITPKVETELTPEERLLRAIFGEKAKDVKDSSVRMPHGQYGKVVAVREIDTVMTCPKCNAQDQYRNGRCLACNDPALPEQKKDDSLPHGTEKRVLIWVVHTRKIQEGDKMAGRHGNKGVVARVVPREDMPFLADGTTVDIILNPIGVPSRMNLGQLMETHLGWALESMGMKARMPVFQSPSTTEVQDMLARKWMLQQSGAVTQHTDEVSNNLDMGVLDNWLQEHGYRRKRLWSDNTNLIGEATNACLRMWLQDCADIEDVASIKRSKLKDVANKRAEELKVPTPVSGKSLLYDGQTGKPFAQPITVGKMYMLKLNHLVEDKIHARSTGPYSLVTQQPLGGKAQFGGQRFGEMEVWALEGYSAAHMLQEILTFKSDDANGRTKAFEAITKGIDQFERTYPESFKVLMRELQGLCISMETLPEYPEDTSVEPSIIDGAYEQNVTSESMPQLKDFSDDGFEISSDFLNNGDPEGYQE